MAIVIAQCYIIFSWEARVHLLPLNIHGAEPDDTALLWCGLWKRIWHRTAHGFRPMKNEYMFGSHV